MYDYEKEIRIQLRNAGLDPDELTDDQRYLIMEPNEAPENFFCDGEITPEEADKNWIKRINNCGLSKLQVYKARKFMDI
jgi:hypothetical protein